LPGNALDDGVASAPPWRVSRLPCNCCSRPDLWSTPRGRRRMASPLSSARPKGASTRHGMAGRTTTLKRRRRSQWRPALSPVMPPHLRPRFPGRSPSPSLFQFGLSHSAPMSSSPGQDLLRRRLSP
jgi:hypothetical protein